MSSWLLVDQHKHRIAKVPDHVANAQRYAMQAEGIWAMYCPQRGPNDLLYATSWPWVLNALGRGTPCPHDTLLH